LHNIVLIKQAVEARARHAHGFLAVAGDGTETELAGFAFAADEDVEDLRGAGGEDLGWFGLPGWFLAS
jgi:hypothetical protein